MDTPFLIAQICFVVFAAVVIYMVVFRKNDFEKQVAFYTPNNHYLPGERLQYLKKMKQYTKYTSILFTVLLIAPVIFISVLLYSSFQDTSMLSISLFLILIELWAIYLLLYVLHKNAKAIQMLVAQMTDDDFHLLLSFRKEWNFLNRYSPSFVFCKDKLYLFTVFSIVETDPKMIQKVTWFWTKGGQKNVFIKTDKRFIIKVPINVYPHFATVLKKYTPNAHIEL